MPTPVEWRNEFQVNTGDAETGGQSDPKIISLSDGRILIAWTESVSGAIGTEAGTDIIGQLCDAQGVPFAAPFKLNSFSLSDDEGDFDIAATNDNGWILVYVDDDISSPNQTGIIWERHDGSGNLDSFESIAFENVAADFLANPQLTVNQLTNESLVSFTRDVGADTNVRAVHVSADGVAGPEFNAAQNSTDVDANGDVAILENGNFVSVYEEDDAGIIGIEVRIFAANGQFINSFTADTEGADPRVATLANGNFVVAWQATDTLNIRYAIYRPDGDLLHGPFAAVSTADDENEPDVVALPDGDFVICWDNETDGSLEAQRFNASSEKDGSVFIVENVSTIGPDMNVTGDGRILFTWDEQTGGGDIFASIWDPRESPVDAADYQANVRNFVDTLAVTGLTTSTILNGNGLVGAVLFGQGGDDTITGGAGTQTLIGGDGDDVLDGGTESDIMVGGDGDDIYFVNNASLDPLAEVDRVIEGLNAGNDTIYSSVSYALGDGNQVETLATINQAATTVIHLTGNMFANILYGNAGGNILNGGGGADIMTGFGGNDIYFRDHVGDQIGEQAAGGTDTVFSLLGYGLGANLENLVLTGAAAFNGYGNDLDNHITGNGAANTLNGGLGADVMVGGAGDDIYVRDNAGDQVGEDAAGGSDTVHSSLGYGLGANLENLVLTGVTAINGYGNDLANRLTGNGAANTLNGGLGADIMLGGAGDDLYVRDNAGDQIGEDAGAGIDAVYSSLSYGLGANLENLFLTGAAAINGYGNDLANFITGNDAANSINGGLGADVMLGGLGNDIYVRDNGGDQIGEDAGAGIDTVHSTLTYGLGANLEHLLLLGAAAIDGFGNDLANAMTGNGAANTLVGGNGGDALDGEGGNDRLHGGLGSDSLVGGAGADGFYFDTVFNAATNIDQIIDFSVADDTIFLDNAVFAGLAAGALSANAFRTGAAAADADDRIVYNNATGQLLFDADGVGGAAAVQFANIQAGLALTAGDFTVI